MSMSGSVVGAHALLKTEVKSTRKHVKTENIWVRTRIHKNKRPDVPPSLARSNHTFGELQITKNAIVTTATLAVRPLSGTTAKTSEFQHSLEEIYDVTIPIPFG